jgi:hypothetical protein
VFYQSAACLSRSHPFLQYVKSFPDFKAAVDEVQGSIRSAILACQARACLFACVHACSTCVNVCTFIWEGNELYAVSACASFLAVWVVHLQHFRGHLHSHCSCTPKVEDMQAFTLCSCFCAPIEVVVTLHLLHVPLLRRSPGSRLGSRHSNS